MDHYIIWFNLKESEKGLSFAKDLKSYLDHLKGKSLISNYRLWRRKLGFSPNEMTDFMIDIEYEDLTQLDKAFQEVIKGDEVIKSLHRNVYSKVKDFKSALYRDYPDEIESL